MNDLKKQYTETNFSGNIMLIGFMGSGKSTIARQLRKALGLEQIEMDALISKREGMSITEIFQHYGETYFRDCETSLLKELSKKNNIVVSCGGGVVLRDENIVHMKANGCIVLLNASPEVILKRVKHSNERPLLNNNMNVEYIAEMMEKREPRYIAAADIIIDTDYKTAEEICTELIEKVRYLLKY